MISSDIVSVINEHDNIAIVSHTMSDGDSLGSMLALSTALLDMGKKIRVFTDSVIPKRYEFLPNVSIIEVYESGPDDFYLLIILDCSDEKRLDKCKELIDKSQVVVNIDHHVSNTMFANLNFIDTNASSTAEIVYQVIKLLGVGITKDIAINLYTGISTDTGNFSYSNTTSVTHIIAGELLNHGIDIDILAWELFRKRSINSTKALGMILNTMELFCNDRLVFINFPLEMQQHENGLAIEDAEGAIEYARDIEGIQLAAFFKEMGVNNIRVSLRSNNDDMDVNLIASKFQGGGHRRAAGYTAELSLNECKDSLLNEIIPLFD